MKAFISWSGGKEISFAYYRAKKRFDNFEVKYLLNMVSSDGSHSRTHGINSALLRAQAKAIGIPILQRKSSWEDYEKKFKKAIFLFWMTLDSMHQTDKTGYRCLKSQKTDMVKNPPSQYHNYRLKTGMRSQVILQLPMLSVIDWFIQHTKLNSKEIQSEKIRIKKIDKSLPIF